MQRRTVIFLAVIATTTTLWVGGCGALIGLIVHEQNRQYLTVEDPTSAKARGYMRDFETPQIAPATISKLKDCKVPREPRSCDQHRQLVQISAKEHGHNYEITAGEAGPAERRVRSTSDVQGDGSVDDLAERQEEDVPGFEFSIGDELQGVTLMTPQLEADGATLRLVYEYSCQLPDSDSSDYPASGTSCVELRGERQLLYVYQTDETYARIAVTDFAAPGERVGPNLCEVTQALEIPGFDEQWCLDSHHELSARAGQIETSRPQTRGR
jgi:hypothetical protein